mmetsp:Transcript_3619/g.9364  ORF Transcript_3619/g.9364 Transcript_3619/m.9364 type:complete len:202 (-) Transcript_3619:852-1457(-)
MPVSARKPVRRRPRKTESATKPAVSSDDCFCAVVSCERSCAIVRSCSSARDARACASTDAACAAPTVRDCDCSAAVPSFKRPHVLRPESASIPDAALARSIRVSFRAWSSFEESVRAIINWMAYPKSESSSLCNWNSERCDQRAYAAPGSATMVARAGGNSSPSLDCRFSSSDASPTSWYGCSVVATRPAMRTSMVPLMRT